MEHFYDAVRSNSVKRFTQRGLGMNKVESSKVVDQTLTGTHSYGVESVAQLGSTVTFTSRGPVLRFLTPFLSDGSVVVFDDWRSFRNKPDFGEQGRVASG
jgi:hypothetical protein